MLNISKSVGLALCLGSAAFWPAAQALEQNTQALAQSAPQAVYSLQDAVNLTLQQHPALAPFAYREQVQQGLIKQAEVGSPVTIRAQVNDLFGTGDYSALAGMQTELGIAWLLEQPKLKAQVGVAKTEAELIQLERQMKAIDLAAKTASDYVVLLAQQEYLKLAKLRQHQAQSMLVDIQGRIAAGQVSNIDGLRAKADLANKALVVEDFIHEIEASKALIAAQWQGSDTFTAKGRLSQLPEVPSLAKLKQTLKANPAFQHFAKQERVADSKIHLAEVDNKPAWRVNTGVKHNQALGDVALSAGIEIPWSDGNRNLGQIRALHAQKLEYQTQAQALESELSTQLLLLTHKLKHNAHVVEGLVEAIIPALEQASEQAQQAYLQGNYRYSDWYGIQQELNTAQTELIQAYSNIHLFYIELQRLTGTAQFSGSTL